MARRRQDETTRSATGAAGNGDDRIRRAVELLVEELQRRLERHPGGHLLAHRATHVELPLFLPTAGRPDELTAAQQAAGDALGAAVRSLLAHQAAFRPGRVYCLRCRSSDCEHSVPPGPDHVFAGYGPTGQPRFAPFGQWLLQRGDPRVDQLYEEPPRFLVHTAREGELTAALLDLYRDEDAGFRSHGQVAAGWYTGRDEAGRPAQVAICFQLLSTRTGDPGGRRAAPRRYALNVVGVGPGGESLEHFCDRLGSIPWSGPVSWASSVLDQLGRSGPGGERGRRKRIDRLLDNLARRLAKDRRARDRRTRHAQQRHSSGDRPTRMAFADLERADLGNVVVDTRKDTLVVLGEKGRAHVFNRRGRLVTSIRYNPEAIERRRKNERWRDADKAEIAQLKERVESPAP